MRSRAKNGGVIFYDIYSNSEKAADPRKNDMALFFFKGNAGEKFAVCSADGGFAYVGAIQDSFPHALKLSKRSYNAFAVIYRPGAEGFGERTLPHAGAVIMQYTGLSEYSEDDPPTYVCVGDSDGIVNWQTMKTRLDNMSKLGIYTEFHVYKGLRHGFGIDMGTVTRVG